MPSYLPSNLDALRERNPDLAERIAALDRGLPPHLELVPTKTPLAAVRYLPPDNSAPRALCSTYDPLREAHRWAENDPVSSAINLIFLGVGLGYHITAYLGQFGRHARSVTLVEFDPYLFRLALSVLDLRDVIGSESCLCLVAEEPEDLPDLLAPLRTKFMVHNFKILHHRPSQQVKPEYYLEVAQKIIDVATFDEVNTRTLLGQRQRNQENVLRNLGVFWRGRLPAEYRNAAQGLPAIVVAAGPSLDRNVHELHRIGSHGLIISVDTSQNTLAHQGIRPHFVATADPTQLNLSHFEKVSDLGNSILAFHPECYYGIARMFPNHPYLFPLADQQGSLLRHLREVLRESLGEVGYVPRGMNVGQIAFNIACHLGCDPIILAGMDFAFAPGGGLTHARDAALARSTSPVGEDRGMTVGPKAGKADAEHGTVVFVPGYYGGQVPTSVSFQQYIKDLEETIRESGRRVIDATEGGARKTGTEIMTLKEAINGLDRAVDVRPFLDRFRTPVPARDRGPLVAELRKGQTVLVKSKGIVETALARISTWPGICAGTPPSEQQVQHEWDELEAMWQAMLADPLFNIFLDTAVTYLYYRRMRADEPTDDSPRAYLECMYHKYRFILTEMNLMLAHFISVLDEVCAELSCGSA